MVFPNQFLESRADPADAAVLGGDFSQYKTTASGSVVPIYDPSTGNPDGTGRTQFPGNVIPASRIDPISLKFIQLFYAPAQNSAIPEQLHISSNPRGTLTTALTCAAITTSHRSRSLPSASAMAWKRTPPRQFQTAGGTTGSNIITKYYQYMGSHTWTPSPTVVNVATFGWTNFYNSLGLYSQGVNNAVGKLGIPGLQPGIPATWGIPSRRLYGGYLQRHWRQHRRSVCDQRPQYLDQRQLHLGAWQAFHVFRFPVRAADL